MGNFNIGRQVATWISVVFFSIFWFIVVVPSAFNGSGFAILMALFGTALWFAFGLTYILRRWRPVKLYFQGLYRDH